ncbi:VOC family protein [bacterium]|nr:VOC family protein [candidate division CSSED10-310 bacterium]
MFEDLFQFNLAWSFDISADIMLNLFGLPCTASVRTYDLGNSKLEVFILKDMPVPGRIQHVCLEFDDRDSVIRRAAKKGFSVRRYRRTDGEVIFLEDADGNLYELKNRIPR